MKLKLTVIALLLAAFSGRLSAQQTTPSLSNPVGGQIFTAGATCIATTQACIWQKLPSPATTTTVTITGTFTATLIIETSADSGNTWTQQSSQSAPVVVTFTVTSFTDVRVRASAISSGFASVNIQTSGNQQNISTGGGGFPVTTPVTVSSGGSISATGTGAINATSLAGTVAGQNPVTQSIFAADPKYGAKFNGKAFFSNVNTCSWAGAQATFTCTGAGFTAADVGKQLSATVNGCCGVSANYSGVAATNPASSTTILSVQDSTHATASQNFVNASGANWIIWWATNDDVAISAAETDAASANKCQAIVLPAGITALLQPHFNSPGANCLGAEPQADYTEMVSGQGIGATVLGIATGYNFTGCPSGAGGCFFGYLESTARDFQINGFGWGNTGLGAARNLITVALGSQWSQVACNAVGGSDTNLIGLSAAVGARFWGLSIDGCGNIGANIGGGIVKFYYCFMGDTLGANMIVNATADVTDFGCDYGLAGGTTILRIDGRYHGIGSNLFGCGITNATAINQSNGANSEVILDGARWNCGSTTGNGVFMNGAGQKLVLTGGTHVGGTSSVVLRNGGTVFTSPDTLFQGGGAITTLAPTCTVTGAGATATCASDAGNTNEKGTLLITAAGAGPAALGTIIMTFAGTFSGPSVAAPSCNWTLDNTGNTAWNARATLIKGATSTTSHTVNWDNNAVALVATNTLRAGYICIAR